MGLAFLFIWPLYYMRFETRGYFIIGVSTILALAFLIYRFILKDSPLHPPGPSGYYLLGYLPFLGKQPYKKLGDLKERYGPICGVQLGNRQAVVINKYEILNELVKEKHKVFCGFPRPSSLPIPGQRLDFEYVNPVRSVQHKRFIRDTICVLRDTLMETIVKNELESFTALLQDLGEKPADFQPILKKSFHTQLEKLIFGRSFPEENNKFTNLMKLLDEESDLMNELALFHILPKVKNIPFINKKTNDAELQEIYYNIHDHSFRLTSEFESDPENGQTCLLDIYRTETNSRQEASKEESIFDGESLQMDLVAVLHYLKDLPWVTTMWGLLFLARYQDVQDKVYNELKKRYGDNHTPRWEDHSELPYTSATIMEICRVATVYPLYALPSNIQNSTLYCFKIPANSCIIGNAWKIHNDPEVWTDPSTFRPERFLTEEKTGFALNKHEHLLPFFLGTKTWVDEEMIHMQIFLYLTTLLLRFSFHPPSGAEVQLNSMDGYIVKPQVGVLRAMLR